MTGRGGFFLSDEGRKKFGSEPPKGAKNSNSGQLFESLVRVFHFKVENSRRDFCFQIEVSELKSLVFGFSKLDQVSNFPRVFPLREEPMGFRRTVLSYPYFFFPLARGKKNHVDYEYMSGIFSRFGLSTYFSTVETSTKNGRTTSPRTRSKLIFEISPSTILFTVRTP